MVSRMGGWEQAGRNGRVVFSDAARVPGAGVGVDAWGGVAVRRVDWGGGSPRRRVVSMIGEDGLLPLSGKEGTGTWFVTVGPIRANAVGEGSR
jgi:hypothetical protein